MVTGQSMRVPLVIASKMSLYCSLILYIHASVRTSYVHIRMCITLQDP